MVSNSGEWNINNKNNFDVFRCLEEPQGIGQSKPLFWIFLFERTRYDVKTAKLGEGGFSSVFLATERESDQDCVAKIVKDKAKAEEEVRIVARLNNEFIIRYYSNEKSPDGIEL